MTSRLSTSHAASAVVALTLAVAATAGAQQSSPSKRVHKDMPPTTSTSTPSRVTKDQTPAPAPTPTPAPDTTASAPAATPAPTPTPVDTSSTTTVTTTTTQTSTGEVMPTPAPSMHRFGNGFYVGVAAGAAMPRGNLDQVYRTGYNVEVPICWDPIRSPLGVRVNLGYGRLRANSNFRYTGASGSLVTPNDAQIWQGVLDAKLNLPIGHFLGATSNVYAVGGGGAYYFRNYGYAGGAAASTTTSPTTTGSTTGTTGTTSGGTYGTTSGTSGTAQAPLGYTANGQSYSSADRQTRFGANVGGGVSWGIGRASLYAESRFVRVFVPNRTSDYVPVMLGIMFH